MSGRALALGAVLILVGCGGGGGNPQPDASTPFLAFATDFTGYHSWQHYDTSDAGVLVGIHDGRPITEYINDLPPHGSTTFPIGTIVVKEVSGPEPDGGSHPVLAMVKREVCWRGNRLRIGAGSVLTQDPIPVRLRGNEPVREAA